MGYFKLERKLKDHWIWQSNEPYDKRSAWIDIIMNANYSDREWQPNAKETVIISRGSFPTSEIKLATKWKWDRGKVRRFLAMLEKDGMIKKTATKNYIIISLINYEKYQDNPLNEHYNERTTEATTDTTTNATTQSTENTKVEGIDTTTNTQVNTTTNIFKTNTLEINNKDNKDIYIVQSEEIWKLYPNKIGKKKSMPRIVKALKQYGIDKMKQAIQRYIAYVDKQRGSGFNLQYQNGSTFFNGTFEDYLDENYNPESQTTTNQKNQSLDDMFNQIKF